MLMRARELSLEIEDFVGVEDVLGIEGLFQSSQEIDLTGVKIHFLLKTSHL